MLTARDRSDRLQWLPWAALGLLVAEALTLSLLFDALSVVQRGGVFGLLGSMGYALTLLACVTTALILLLPRTRSVGSVTGGQVLRERLNLAALLVHCAAYGALLAVSFALFGAPASNNPTSTALAVAWAASGAASVASLALVIWPWRAALRACRKHWRALVGAVAFGTLAWVAGTLAGTAWDQLADLTLEAVAALLFKLEPEVVVASSEKMIGTPGFSIQVASVCSGFESMGLIVVFLGLFVGVAREDLRLRRIWILFPLAIVLAWSLNVVRIAVLVEVGTHVSRAVALSGFHSKLGWVFFCAISLALAAAARRSAFFGRAAGLERDEEPAHNPTAVYLAPLMALLGAALLSGLFSAGFDSAYGLRVVATLIALVAVRSHFHPVTFAVSWQAVAIGAAAFLLWILLNPPADAEAVGAWKAGLDALPPVLGITWIVVRIIGATMTAPLAEELAFRGYLLPRIISADFTSVNPRRWTWTSVLVSSLTFGFLHEQWMAATLTGALYALARASRGRLVDAVVAHAVTNGMLAAYVIVSGRWEYCL